MFRILLLTVILSGCTSNIIPETGNQIKIVGYSQLISVTLEVHEACKSKVITKETCIDLHDRLQTAEGLIGEHSNRAADLLTYIRSKI